MKRLLLASLISGTAIFSLQPPKALADCVYKATYYFEYPGGPECGLTYQYCESPRYHEGCTTAYYEEDYFCECP